MDLAVPALDASRNFGHPRVRPAGHRLVERVGLFAQMVVGEAGEVEQMWTCRTMGPASRRPNAHTGTDVSELGDSAHRAFTLAVAAAAVAELTMEAGATLTSVAQEWDCGRRTMARWRTSVAGMAGSSSLAKLCSRLDPDGLPAPEPEGLARPGTGPAPAGAPGPAAPGPRGPLEPGPGLGAILRHQFERFRAVSWLTRGSPALQVVGAMAVG